MSSFLPPRSRKGSRCARYWGNTLTRRCTRRVSAFPDETQPPWRHGSKGKAFGDGPLEDLRAQKAEGVLLWVPKRRLEWPGLAQVLKNSYVEMAARDLRPLSPLLSFSASIVRLKWIFRRAILSFLLQPRVNDLACLAVWSPQISWTWRNYEGRSEAWEGCARDLGRPSWSSKRRDGSRLSDGEDTLYADYGLCD